jgi:hypothetical protein
MKGMLYISYRQRFTNDAERRELGQIGHCVRRTAKVRESAEIVTLC